MSFHIITDGDILQQDADVIVIPVSPEILPKFGTSARVFAAVGYDIIGNATKDVGTLEFGEIAVVPCSGIKARHIILLCTPIFKYGSNKEKRLDRHKAEYLLQKGIRKALLWADGNGAKSMAFAVLKSNILQKNINTITEGAIRSYINTVESRLDVYYFCAPRVDPFYETSHSSPPSSSVPPTPADIAPENKPTEFNIKGDIFTEYEIRLGEEFTKSGMTKDIFNREVITGIIKKYKENKKFIADRIAKAINYDKSTISRFVNGKVYKPDKKHLIAMAVLSGFDNEERYRFINCAGHEYPSERLDSVVEYLIRNEGITDFETLNRRLCGINPDYALNQKSNRGGMSKKQQAEEKERLKKKENSQNNQTYENR